MRRCLVPGSGGAGKTHFSLALGEVTGLPVVHLDRLGDLGPETAVHVLRGRRAQDRFLAALREDRER